MENNLEISEEVFNLNINVNSHSSIQVNNMIFDPYNITDTTTKAKYIFLTHTHYDHLSLDDIDKVITDNSVFIAPHDAKEHLEKYKQTKHFVNPNQQFDIEDIKIETLASYNINKNFHKKEYNWLGFKVTFKNDLSFAILGDTDKTPELESLKCDILFVPIGGTYTMNALEAAELANIIMPQLVIPVHYGSIVGTKEDAEVFTSKINENIACKTFF